MNYIKKRLMYICCVKVDMGGWRKVYKSVLVGNWSLVKKDNCISETLCSRNELYGFCIL